MGIHRGQGETTTWSFGHSKMGDLKLLHPRFKEDASLNNAEATALTLTACGNFVLIGYSTGHVDRFNIPYFTFSLMLASKVQHSIRPSSRELRARQEASAQECCQRNCYLRGQYVQ